jgi:hypothetical protein
VEFPVPDRFLYPKKYRMIQEYRDQFKETYRKLYCNHPEVAEHFLYQKTASSTGTSRWSRPTSGRGWCITWRRGARDRFG